MSMTLSQMRVNKTAWASKEKFRYNRWSYWFHSKRFSLAKRKELRGKWWNLYVEARDKRAWYAHEIAKREGSAPTHGLVIFDGHPVAAWMVPRLVWYRQHGWTGYVVSGWRSHAAQWAAAVRYGLYHYANNDPFHSNHLFYEYPGGAVDVTNYEQLAQVIRNHPYPGGKNFIWAGPTIGDVVHFSANGH